MTDDNGPWSAPPPRPAPRRRLSHVLPWLLFAGALAALIVVLALNFPFAVQESQDWAQVAYFAGFLLLISAGAFRARRGFRVAHLRYAALWTAIAAVLVLAYAYRSEFADVGRRLQLTLSSGHPVATGEREMSIPRAEDGSFVVLAKVNGQPVRFVVDTGASDMVLSPADARRAGVDLSRLRFDRASETANGVGYGARYVAPRLELGPLVRTDVPMVVNQAPMSGSLLGMSFLRELESFRVEGDALVLRWRAAAG